MTIVVHVAIVVVLGPGGSGGLLGIADDQSHARVYALVGLLDR